MLDEDTRRELRSLTKDTAELVAQHLVMTGRLLDDGPEQALAHARAARALAGRIGVVRQAAGLAAYAAGEWSEALSELRAARRITGRPEHLAVMADCERALGRPERALGYADDPEVPSLSQDERVELVIVLAGARRDMGQLDAAVLVLQDPARRTSSKRPWAARLWYAFADALLTAGREDEAREWFGKTADVDDEGQTDAADRVLELDGVVLEDLGEDDEDAVGGMDDAALAAYVASGFTTVETARSVAEDAQTDESASDEDRTVALSSPDAVTTSGTGEDEPQPEVESSAVSPTMTDPFSGRPAATTLAATSRPAAALTPTFAAPADDAAASVAGAAPAVEDEAASAEGAQADSDGPSGRDDVVAVQESAVATGDGTEVAGARDGDEGGDELTLFR